MHRLELTAARLVLALTTGALLSFGHEGWPIAGVVAPVPLLVALRNTTPRIALYCGVMCGAAETWVVLGVLEAGVPVLIALALSFILGRVIFCMGSTALNATTMTTQVVGPAALWTLIEIGHAALPLSAPTILGNTQSAGPLLFVARLGGAFGISFCIIALASTSIQLTLGTESLKIRARLGATVVFTGTVVLTLAVAAAPQSAGVQRTVRAVQGGLPTWVYTRAENQAAWADVPLEAYATLTAVQPPADLVVWPETAAWRVWNDDTAYARTLRALASDAGTLLVGTLRRDAGHHLFNSAVALTRERTQTVDKRRLALFAEHRLTPGIGLPTVMVGQHPVGVVFCLESVSPAYTAALARDGVELLVVLADGSRFGTHPVGAVHARYSVVRAMETGLYVVHAGQQGHTRIIDPFGVSSEPAAPFTAQVVSATASLRPARTPFVRWGQILPGVLLAVLLLCLRRQKSYSTQ